MRWTVIWDPPTRDELAEIWMRSPDRAAVSAAADRIDAELAVDALEKGEDFYGQRILVIEPLAAVFSVHPDDRLVRVRLLFARE